MFAAFYLAAAETVAVGEIEEYAGDDVFPILDAQYFLPQLFWLGLTFLLLYFLLAKVFLPGVGRTLEDRSSRIADDVDSAARMQREAEEASESYERSLKDARAKAHTVTEATRASVDAEIATEMEKADAEAAKAASVAEDRIRDIRTAAMANIDAVAREAAGAIADKLSGKAARRPARRRADKTAAKKA